MLQTEALNILKMGHNVYLTGAAGSGKTFVLNKFIDYLHDNAIGVGVTASTGIAATHINGMTIHSWSGIGVQDALSEYDLEKLMAKGPLKKRFQETKVLIIDEISMLHGARLDMIDLVCRTFKDSSKPFGGLQVVMCGDLFQLPPVSKDKQVDFVFYSQSWKTMNLKVCYLSEQYRQDDQRLLDVLGAIRANAVDESHFEYLQDRFRSAPADVSATKLYTHNVAVDEFNENELAKLDGDEQTYAMQSTGNQRAAEALAKNCLAPEVLRLKVGAKVMFVANNPAEHFVNGTQGEVIGFNDDNLPVVQTANRTIFVEKHSWKMQDGVKTVAEISQVPLRLAWAITVHKSQGMSLDAAEIDLSKSFEPGMGYVALSRVRQMDGLFIKGMNNTAMVVHPDVTVLDQTLREHSNALKKQLATILPDKLEEHHAKVRRALISDEAKLLENYDEDLLKELKKWRTKLAKQQSIPAYMILADKSLKLIAAVKPQNKSQLAAIHGIGAQKLEKYHADILNLTT